MTDTISAAARHVADVWALSRGTRTVPPLVRRGIAQQAQDHLEHGADRDYLVEVAAWMGDKQPTWQDLDAAMRFASAPKPPIPARRGHPCVCRGGRPLGGGAPAPPVLRQLIRTGRRPARAA